ncbi:NAD(P)-binding domain-containing protein, partial [Hoeflea sp. BAL378]|uniref:flavin-containing monooxygenase n=1 Tax=Hoeflea sp. BAL378 TaxID=1547437 RepID=UPI001378FB88
MDHYRVCVVGAGPTGLATLRALTEAGIGDIICHESRGESGGIWVYSEDADRPSVYRTAHTISSKHLSQFRDFPMPDDYPDYPSNRQVLAYMRAYEAHFGLTRPIRFNSTVTAVGRRAGGGWEITYEDATGRHSHTADVLFVCSGHHRAPAMPDLPGDFSGTQMHSARYKTAAGFAGQRVLVVGGGNSACDIAAEISRVADHVSLSIRSPQYILPKLVGGRPVDVQFAKLHKPLFRWARDLIIRAALAADVGPYTRYGLQQPDFPVLSRHPTLNTVILDLIRHGKVRPRMGIAGASGRTVRFADGSEDDFDAIVWATGFKLGAPFLRDVCPNWSDAVTVPLYHKMMLADAPGLYFIGLIQPVGCIWVLAELQARVAVAEI